MMNSVLRSVLPAANRDRFTALNTSPLLINVHVLNILITLLDFTSAPRHLTFLDLHVAVAVALIYIVLQIAIGMHAIWGNLL